jgi:translation initiation factor 5
MVNLNGSDDPFYRYQMDEIQVKVEGKGKMIKSHLINLEKVASQIERPIEYILSYIGAEIGAASKIDKENNQLKPWVGGELTQKQTQEYIFKFVRNFVNCKKCNNPETKCFIEGKKKNTTVHLQCASCGNRSDLNSGHKLNKVIINDLSK